MKTVFLASGRSSRMAPITDKSLLSFCGKPLCIHLLQNAERAGLQDFVIVVNESNKEAIEEHLQSYNIQAQTIIQPNLDEGMAGGIEAGLSLVDDEESVIILGGNDYVEQIAYTDIQKTLKEADGALLAKKVDQYFPGGYLEIDEHKKITSIIEKPGEGNEPSDLVNIVVHGFAKAGSIKHELASVSKSSGDAYEKALGYLFDSHVIKAVDYKDIWQAIKYPWHVLDMKDILLTQTLESINPQEYDQKDDNVWIHKTATVADTARIRGEKIIIGPNSKIFDNAVIQQHSYIGENCIVGNNALVREAHIGDFSTVGYNTEVARTYFHKEVTTHMAYVGDSIVEKGVNFGAFSTTANLRLDKNPVKVTIKEERISSRKPKLGAIIGPEAQIGIHACLMPGCKIEAQQLVLPGSIEK